MRVADLIGYTASVFVLLTFYMKEMALLRLAALCSNVCFLAYGISLRLEPVVVLHATLIPLNAWRLSQALGVPADTWIARCRLKFHRWLRRA